MVKQSSNTLDGMGVGIVQIKSVAFLLFMCSFLSLSAQNTGDLFVRGSITLEENAELYVRGDIRIITDDANIQHSGKIELEGNLLNVEDGNFSAFSGSKVIFRNDEYNVDSCQYMLGDFDDDFAFSSLEIDNRAPNPLFLFLGEKLTIQDELVLTRGEVSTVIPEGIFIPGFDDVDIEDLSETEIELENSAANSLVVDLEESFISAPFERTVTGTGVYVFPVGSSDPSSYGPQTVYILGNDDVQFDLSVEFDADDMINVPTPHSICDIGTPPFNFTTPDGLLDTLILDCIAGGWTLTTDSNAPYNALTAANNNLISQCNIGYNYLLVDGVPVSDCPANLFQTPQLSGDTELTIAGISNIQDVLFPIELISFQLNTVGRNFELLWQTATEINFSGFELQRSLNSVDFVPLVWIESKGSPDLPADYSYLDENIQPGQSYYYRLKMVDTDGSSSFSQVLTGRINQQTSGTLAIFPNPVSKSDLVIQFESVREGPMQFELFNHLGQLVWETSSILTSLGQTSLQLPQRLTAGHYVARLRQGEYYRQAPLVISY